MKRVFFLFTSILFCSCLFSSPIKDHQIDQDALSELAVALGISKEDDIIKQTQEHWLRKSRKERWEMDEIPKQQRTYVLDWAKEQGFFDPWKTSDKTYNQALILGATTYRMRTRLEYLKNLWNQGVRFTEIVWLTGERPLDPAADDLLDQAYNESQAARIIWENASLPEGMRRLAVSFVDVPMKANGRRPNTKDTIDAWSEAVPKPCKVFFVSDQPFCGYQFAVIKTCLKGIKDIEFDVVGGGVANPENYPSAAAVILDSIARWIYQEDQYQKKQ